MVTGKAQLASPFILIFSLLIISYIKLPRKLDKALVLLFATITVYYIIGLFVRVFAYVNETYLVSIDSQLMNLLTSFIVLTAYYLYLTKRLVEEKDEKKVFNMCFIPFVISTSVIIIQPYLGIYSIVTNDDGNNTRAMGVFANPNAAGFVAVTTLIMNLYSLSAHNRFTILKILLLPVIFYASIVTISRTAIIVSFCTILVYIIYYGVNYHRLNRSLKLKVLSIALGPILSFSYFYNNLESILADNFDYWQAKKIMSILSLISDRELTDENSSERNYLFAYGIEKVQENPFLGSGLGYFQIFPKYGLGVHNTYLLILGDSGVIPFLMFLFFLFYIVRQSFLIKTNVSFLIIGLMINFMLAIFASHNGFDDKLNNVVIIFCICDLAYGQAINKEEAKIITRKP